MTDASANRLAHTTSPYLRAHRHNPVDWYSWNDEALAEARRSGRPILLSIGYAACHWCHVMADESFSDPETAAVMNRHFVNIKVDREERPDLDRIYQTAHAMLTQRPGGWPLTVVLMPDDLTPFFAGTYFPPQARHGLPAFADLLQRIADVYAEQPEAVREQGERVQQALFAQSRSDEARLPDAALVGQGIDRLLRGADRRHGGYGGAPKFPPSTSLPLLIERGDAAGAPEDVAAHLDHTLAAMASGGLFDHVGGGFFRYCVDADWTIPHFEKMLYDNGQLIGIYARAAAEATDPAAREVLMVVVERCIAWLEQEMFLSDGGLASSLDADSPTEDGHHAEGATYLWSPDDVRSILPKDRAEVVLARFGLNRPPNFEGQWHLVADPRAARSVDLTLLAAEDRSALYAARCRRLQPLRDEKCLTGWNALAATGLLQAGLLHDRSDWCAMGQALIDGLLGPLDAPIEQQRDRLAGLPTSRLHDQDGPPAFLDDLAWLLEAQWWSLQAQPTVVGIERARLIEAQIRAAFADPDQPGGYFLSSARHQSPMGRIKHYSDDAWPSGNAVLADVLIRFGHLLGEPDWLVRAEGILAAARIDIERMPEAHGRLLLALARHHDPEAYVVVRGCADEGWTDAVASLRAQGISVFCAEDPDFLPEKPPSSDVSAPIAYICRGTTCLPPVHSSDALLHGFS